MSKNYELVKTNCSDWRKRGQRYQRGRPGKMGRFDPMIDIRRWQNGEPSKDISLKYEEAEKLLAVLGAELKNNGNG